jgi:hypothetical protein
MKKLYIILLSLAMTSCCSVKLQDVNTWGKVETCKQKDREVAYKSRVRITPNFVVIVYTCYPLIPGDSVVVHNMLEIEK